MQDMEKKGLYVIVSINVERKLCGLGLLGKGGHVGFGKSSHNVIWEGLVSPNYTVTVEQLDSIGFLLLTPWLLRNALSSHSFCTCRSLLLF